VLVFALIVAFEQRLVVVVLTHGGRANRRRARPSASRDAMLLLSRGAWRSDALKGLAADSRLDLRII
jgi:hypothetical protein